LWQLKHESWPAGFGPLGRSWHDEHVVSAARAGSCARWQSWQSLLPAWPAWESALSSWHEVQAFGAIGGVACGWWHSLHATVACWATPACAPCASAWHVMQVGAARGAKE
jgi:hypothetical protein